MLSHVVLVVKVEIVVMVCAAFLLLIFLNFCLFVLSPLGTEGTYSGYYISSIHVRTFDSTFLELGVMHATFWPLLRTQLKWRGRSMRESELSLKAVLSEARYPILTTRTTCGACSMQFAAPQPILNMIGVSGGGTGIWIYSKNWWFLCPLKLEKHKLRDMQDFSAPN